MLNGHGDDIYATGRPIVSNFSSNIYNGTDVSGLEAHLASRTALIRSYPEPDGRSLAARLAEKHGIGTQHIIVTNGATEGIYLIAQALRGTEAAIVTPTFSEYEDACRAHELPVTFTPETDPLPEEAGVLWMCNPNNPTGKATGKTELLDWIGKHPKTLVVIDQSYAFFSTIPGITPAEAVAYPNLILLHSLTKQYAIPGLRLGYLVAHQTIISRIERYRMPWSVNALALEAGHYLLEHETSNRIDMEAYRQETERFRNQLAGIAGVTIFPTDTHFFLGRLEGRSAAELKQYLIQSEGILIRDASNFHGLDSRYFRLATQTPPENDRLTKAIATWIQGC